MTDLNECKHQEKQGLPSWLERTLRCTIDDLSGKTLIRDCHDGKRIADFDDLCSRLCEAATRAIRGEHDGSLAKGQGHQRALRCTDRLMDRIVYAFYGRGPDSGHLLGRGGALGRGGGIIALRREHSSEDRSQPLEMTEGAMRNRIWWLTLLRGILGVLIGLLLIVWPAKSAEALIMLVGAFAVLTGLIGTINAAGARFQLWSFSLVAGVPTILLGLVALLWPGLTATVLIYMVAAWALLFGLVEIAAGISLLRLGPIGALTTGIGLISVVLALLLFLAPTAGVVAACWLIGLYFLSTGGLTVYHAIEVRRRARRVEIV
ncbi:MAG: DUF308 domain-containing protein [Armatimonadota bacterium]|nr:DUF308 domain-containing protein [Armatimonadota bacterium]